MAAADRACTSGEECRNALEDRRAMLAKTEQALAAIAPAPASGAPWDARALESAAKHAFYDLREGRIDDYLAQLCPGFRDTYRRPDMRDKLAARGREFAESNLDLEKLAESGEGYLIFMAFDGGVMQGEVPATRMPRVRAGFEREAGAYCLSLVERLP